ncbi:P-loop containing nucleoside triphosphate hydrolase protein [Lactarius quietus]|nr:P-loop containing nucleoside triphosphate hydrolase protein [Lactarius quietus]
MQRHIFRFLSPRRGLSISWACQRLFISNHFATVTPAYRYSPKPTALPATSSPDVPETSELKQLFQREAPTWAKKVGVTQRLLRFGIPQRELPELLAAFTRDVENGKAFRFQDKTSAHLARLSHDTSSSTRRLAIDQAMTSLLYTWATDPRHQKTVKSAISKETLDRMTRLRTAVDFTRIADNFPIARKMRRKLVLHVGPTNSGKTHTALRTLAASRVGAYGGPLRLLAHEIYQRLNTGQIVPLGADAAENYEVDETSNFDVQVVPGTPRAVLKHGNALFARPCSLLTGDERRVVDGATLSSCTVEMLSLDKRYEVVVIDEIQMIADSQRGHSWTSAVLGAAADELHMCGEERAIPIIEALAEITGDELVINRYERLSPLVVAPKSLELDLSRIRKGDCVVTFSRTNIFNLKREIEENTGLRCAVVYGRLPPEIRAEQAARFNDPNSGFDVLVASDAIGMGLNLKIQRIVFETMSKWDGWVEVPLGASHVKQIAGRAGRFGMSTEGGTGIVTTLEPTDLLPLKDAMDAQPEPLRYARVGFTTSTIHDLFAALPRDSTATTVRDALLFCSVLPPSMAVMEPNAKEAESVRYIDSFSQELASTERALLLQCPFPSIDDRCKAVLGEMFRMYRDRFSVDLRAVLLDSGLLESLEQVLVTKQAETALDRPRQVLASLETLHSILTVYTWLSLRSGIAFHAYDLAVALRKATEEAMGYCLRNVSASSSTRHPERRFDSRTKLLHRGPFVNQKMSRARA